MSDGGDGDESIDGPSLDVHRSPARVREVYDEIAPHFSKTRACPWPEVEEFLREFDRRADDSPGRLGLDIGCGNGRHTRSLAAVVERAVGADVSRGLLQEARTSMRGEGESRAGAWTGELLQADATSLPLAADLADIALYVATLHHLRDRETRVESLRELARALRPDGRALVSAWSTAHDRFDAAPDAREGFDTTVDWTLPGGETVPRFYHIYAPGEFERDLRDAGLAVDAAFVSSGNCYAEVRPG